MEAIKEQIELYGRTLTIETGKVAKQANGSVMVRYGDTVLLAAVVASKNVRTGIDYLPLMIDYREKSYSAGKIPGGFFKREGRPTTKEILNGRLADRSIRPLFSSLIRNDIQISISVLSFDQVNDPDTLGVIAASAALAVSDIPFSMFVGTVRVGKIGDEFIINPTYEEMVKSELEVVASGTREGIVMIETAAKESSEESVSKAIELSVEPILKIIELQEKIASKIAKPKISLVMQEIDGTIKEEIKKIYYSKVESAFFISKKEERVKALELIFEEINKNYDPEETKKIQIKEIFDDLNRDVLRKNLLLGKRADGRKIDEVRPIACEIGVLPRTHGSAIFSRGETQSLVVITLGTSEDQQRLDDIEEEAKKSFMLHYNFPSFSTGEARPDRGPGRREIGHGALAEKAIMAILPSQDEFPYTIRVVSEILGSNGSSSMATVCGSSLSLMDAGVPIKKHVAGLAMGLIKEGDQEIIITDILGMEDHYGDMDFKVAGTVDGICAVQLDLKTTSVSPAFLKKAMQVAKEKRLIILEKMNQAISTTHADLSLYAPRIYVHQIRPEKIGSLIGPGGKTIKSIVEATGVKIDVTDDGKVMIASNDEKKARAALDMVNYFTADAEVGKTYKGKVVKIMDFGAFVEIFPGKDGLVHISQLDEKRVENVRDIVKEGDEITVKVLEIDSQGRVVLSRKQVLREMRDKQA